MKRIFALALALCLMGLAGLGETAPEGLLLNVDGRELTLNFDGSEEYSSVINGRVLASFYTYTDNSERLYELTMTFPEAVQVGDVVDTQYALSQNPDCSVAAIFSTSEAAIYYFSGVMDGQVYPADASFSITFDAVSDSENGRVYMGRLSAHLVGMDMFGGPETERKLLDIADAPFSFTMPARNRRTPENTPQPGTDVPGDTTPPADDLFESTVTPAPTQETVRV